MRIIILKYTDCVEFELADVVIRCLDLAGLREFDLKEVATLVGELESLEEGTGFTDFCYALSVISTCDDLTEEKVIEIIAVVLKYCELTGIDISFFIQTKNELQPPARIQARRQKILEHEYHRQERGFRAYQEEFRRPAVREQDIRKVISHRRREREHDILVRQAAVYAGRSDMQAEGAVCRNGDRRRAVPHQSGNALVDCCIYRGRDTGKEGGGR